MLRNPGEKERLAIVGATGAVGREALSILHAQGVPAERILALASERSAGVRLPYGEGWLAVESVERGMEREGLRYILFAAGAELSQKVSKRFVERGAWVIDNSSAYRMEPGVPLIVPEVNGELLREAAAKGPGIVANPNCSTIILLVALEPLRRAFGGIERVAVSTYQAVSGAGQGGMDELRSQATEVLRGEEARTEFFREPCAFNVFSHDSAVDAATGINGEEMKLIEETRKIWGIADLPISPTCVRVPVFRAHTETVTVKLRRRVCEEEVRDALSRAAGVRVIDDRSGNAFPTPLKAAGRDEILVGRIRPDPGEERDRQGRSRGWGLLVCGDQLRKGAALNALQIIDGLRREGARGSIHRSSVAGSSPAFSSAAPLSGEAD